MLTQIGRYRQLVKISQGSTGVLYKALDTALDRDVALKLLSPQLAQDATALERFKAEARISGRLKHAHIAQALDAGVYEGAAFIAFEFIAGKTLQTALRDQPQLAASTALRIARQIAEALDYAHASGAFHGDVKPANIVLSGSGDETHAVLVDFGLSWLASDATAQTLTGAIYGTPRYIAPEQIQRRNVGASADRYSLACVIYEMLSGAQPFRDGDPSLLLHQHLHTAPDPITESAPHLPNACDAVFARALAKSPEQRFESARAMIAALEAALGWKAKTQPAPQPVASRFQTVGAIAFGLAGVALIGGLVRSALPSFAAPRAAANLVNASTVIATATPDITPVPPAATVTPVASPTADAFAPNPYFIWGLGMTWHSGQNTLYGAFRPVSNAKPGAQFPIVNSVGSVVANRLLVSVDQAGTVYAYDWESGAKRWQVALQRDVVLAPSITGGDLSLVLIIDSDGELHALQLETGERAWAKNSTDYGPINGIVVGESGTDLYATTRTGHLIAMDDSGLVQWTLTPEALGVPQISSQPTRIEDLVVFNSAEKAIAVSLSKRQRAWAVSNQDALVLNPIVVAPTRVIVTDIRRRVIVIDAVLGAPAFVFQANQELAGIASDWGRVVAVGRDGEITAWNLLEGKQLWSIQLDRNVSSRPLIVATTRDNSIEDVFVVIATESGVRYFDLLSGEERIDQRLRTSSAVRDMLVIPPYLLAFEATRAQLYKP